MTAALLPLTPPATLSPVAQEVLRGLTSSPKTLCPWLFYDERGSELFEAITRLEEYYPTRTERGILAAHAGEIIAAARGAGPLTLIELGAGTAAKTGLLLEAAVKRLGAVDYYPIDVSSSALEQAREHLERELPGVRVHPRCADYTDGLGQTAEVPGRRLVLYIGSSIGNFDPPDAEALLRDVRAQLAPGDSLLLGADQIKNRAILQAAYNDAEGVTAAFNLNVLTRLNRELGANFHTRGWTHHAPWNAEASRVEMHLVSTRAQEVSIPALDLTVSFAAGETIHTENSYKFTDARVVELLGQAGFLLHSTWKDAQGWFGVYLATAA